MDLAEDNLPFEVSILLFFALWSTLQGLQKNKKACKHCVYELISGERETNRISKNQLYKGFGKTQKTVDTEFDTFNKL